MYKTVNHLAEMMDICKPEVRRKINRMKRSGAYPQTAFLTNPIRCDLKAVQHFETYQQLILTGGEYPAWRES